MLAQYPIDLIITASGLGVAKQFYSDKVRLDILIEGDEFVTFRCGGGSRPVVTRGSQGGPR